jgi:outer membrane protein assembly factor BamB
MTRKPLLPFLVMLAFVALSCGPRGVAPGPTPASFPSPSLEPEPTPSAVPSPVSPAEDVVKTMGREGSGDGEFRDPQGLVLDREGNIYVADTGNSRVQLLDSQGQFVMVIADERFAGPRYVAVDDLGRIFVSDLAERVHVFSARGDPLQSFGGPGGLPGQFSGIADLAIDEAGEVYVVDGGNGRVQKFSLLSGLLFTFGDEGEPGEVLVRPEGLALDVEGDVYVVDGESRRIHKYTAGGTFVRSFAAGVGAPRDVAVDSEGNIYVSDGEKDVIQVLDPQGRPVLAMGQGQLDDPWGVSLSPEGRVFVVDAGNDRLVALPPAREMPTAVPTPSPEPSPTLTLGPIVGTPPWPMYQADAQHTGRSPAEGPESPSLKWIFRAGLLANSPAIGPDGRVYFGSLDGNLYALGRGGDELWRAPVGQISGVPAISDAGTVYVGVAAPVEAMFYGFRRDGDKSWEFQVESHVVEGAPSLGPDGAIYLAASDPLTARGAVVALDPEGREKWHYDLPSRSPFSPALARDGTVYVGAQNGRLYAFSPEGSLKWEASLGAVTSSPSVAADSTIYLGAGSSYQALNPADGGKIWAFSPVDGEADSTPSLGKGGRVYVTSNSNELYAIKVDGTTAWVFSAEAEGEREVHFSSPITIDGAGILYAGTREGELFSVNLDGSLRWRFALPEGGVVLVGPAIGRDGTLYVGAGSNLYAVGQ